LWIEATVVGTGVTVPVLVGVGVAVAVGVALGVSVLVGVRCGFPLAMLVAAPPPIAYPARHTLTVTAIVFRALRVVIACFPSRVYSRY
jgi:hypothetical protein